MTGGMQHGYIHGGLDGNHLIGLGGLPTVILGPGAGAGSAIVTGTDTACTVVLTVGAGSANNSIVFTLVFDTAFDVVPHTVVSAGNRNAAASNARIWVNNPGLVNFTINVTNPALTTGHVYVFKFLTFG